MNEEKYTTEHLLLAASIGNFWLVKKCLQDKSVQVNVNDDEPLYNAVLNGRTSIVQFLLDNGSCAESRDVLCMSCDKGYSRITNILLKRGIKDDVKNRALLYAIRNGNTDCVKSLLENGVDVHVDNDLPILEACRKGHQTILRMLLKSGAYVDCQNGQPLIECAKNDTSEIAEILIENGADVRMNDSKALRVSLDEKHISVTIVILNKGGDILVLNECDLDDPLKTLIYLHARKGVISRLRRSIKDSMLKQDFKWQIMCSRSRPNMSDLREQALLHGLEVSSDDTKYSLCAKMAVKYEKSLTDRNINEKGMTDFSGTPLRELPFWKIMIIDDIPFNCFDLFSMIQHNITCNPYTRSPLPVEKILDYYDYLKKTVSEYRFEKKNLLETIQNEPIMTERMELKFKLEKEVWDHLCYPPSMSVIMDATDSMIDEMVDKLSIICKRKSIFDLIRPTADIYTMFKPLDKYMIKDSKGLYKKKVFVHLLSKLVNTDDEHKDTRRISVSIMLRSFSEGSNSSGSDDDYTFMMENGTLDTDDDYYLMNDIWSIGYI